MKDIKDYQGLVKAEVGFTISAAEGSILQRTVFRSWSVEDKMKGNPMKAIALWSTGGYTCSRPAKNWRWIPFMTLWWRWEGETVDNRGKTFLWNLRLFLCLIGQINWSICQVTQAIHALRERQCCKRLQWKHFWRLSKLMARVSCSSASYTGNAFAMIWSTPVFSPEDGQGITSHCTRSSREGVHIYWLTPKCALLFFNLFLLYWYLLYL